MENHLTFRPKKWSWSLTEGGRGGGGKGRGLGLRNDVLTTCKAVTKRGVQRKITVFYTQ